MKKFVAVISLFLAGGCTRMLPYIPSAVEAERIEKNIAARYEKESKAITAKEEYKKKSLINVDKELAVIKAKKYPNWSCKDSIVQFAKEKIEYKDYKIIEAKEEKRIYGAIQCSVFYKYYVPMHGKYISDYASYWMFNNEKGGAAYRILPPDWLYLCGYKDKGEIEACIKESLEKENADLESENDKKEWELKSALWDLESKIRREENDTPQRKEYYKNPKKEIDWDKTVAGILLSPLYVILSPIILLSWLNRK